MCAVLPMTEAFDPNGAASSAAALRALINEAWDHTYVDMRRAGEIGREVLRRTEHDPTNPIRGWAWFHVGYACLRVREAAAAVEANEQARRIFMRDHDQRGLLMCLEFDALHGRAEGRLQEAMALHQKIAATEGVHREPIDLYISYNSRAITRKLLGQTDETLFDFYRALEVAQDVASPGPRINALVNLGGYHGDLFNLQDCCELSAQAMDLSEEVGAWTAFAIAGVNFIQSADGLGRADDCLATAQRLLRHEQVLPGLQTSSAPWVALALLNGGQLDQAAQWLSRGACAVVADGDGKSEWARVSARYRMLTGDVAGAREIAETRLLECRAKQIDEQPYTRMKLLEVVTDACEALGDTAAALTYFREAHRVYESLVGTGARARFVALRTQHDLVQAQRDRDHARHAHEAAERDRQRLAELNAALEQKIEEARVLQEQLHEQAVRDPLTGLHNRRYLYEVASGRLELARRQQATIAIALLDIDLFKRLNDTYGHEAGDQVLQRFAGLLRERLRRSDVICRFGGEEFVLLAADAGREQALAVLADLLREFAAQQVDTDRGPITGVTFSAGVALFPEDGADLDSLLKLADARLYRAKDAGRACACAASPA